jgi:hypothetical protein
MTNFTIKAIAAATVIGMAALTVAPPAEAGRGYRGGYHRGGGGGDALAAGLIGLGVGAVIGSALTPREVYVTPPPPPPPRAYYGPAAYGAYGGPAPWTGPWYRYCRDLHGPYFDANTGYYQGGDGGVYFCR